MIGWFALNVPSGLTLYWFTNNILTVGQTVLLRSNFKQPEFNEVSTSGNTIEVERVSAVQPKQVESKPKGRSGEKFWELMNQEKKNDGGNGSIVAEVLSKPSEPARGSKFRELQQQERKSSVTTTTVAATTEVASSEPVVQAIAAEVTEVEADAPEPVVKVEAAAQQGSPSPAKKTSALKKKGKGKGKYQQRRKK